MRAGGAKSLQISFWLAVEWLGQRKKERKTKKINKKKKKRQSVLVKDRKHCTSLTLSPRPPNELRQERACVRAHFGWLGWGDWSVCFGKVSRGLLASHGGEVPLMEIQNQIFCLLRLTPFRETHPPPNPPPPPNSQHTPLCSPSTFGRLDFAHLTQSKRVRVTFAPKVLTLKKGSENTATH